jgi:hypothetical protein
MPHARVSCRGRMVKFLRLELEQLYAQRSEVDAAIQALQNLVEGPRFEPETANRKTTLEFRTKACNLTNCRSA